MPYNQQIKKHEAKIKLIATEEALFLMQQIKKLKEQFSALVPYVYDSREKPPTTLAGMVKDLEKKLVKARVEEVNADADKWHKFRPSPEGNLRIPTQPIKVKAKPSRDTAAMARRKFLVDAAESPDKVAKSLSEFYRKEIMECLTDGPCTSQEIMLLTRANGSHYGVITTVLRELKAEKKIFMTSGQKTPTYNVWKNNPATKAKHGRRVVE